MEKAKQLWAEPKLIVFGDVEKLTLANNKTGGIGDSFTFNQQPTKISG